MSELVEDAYETNEDGWVSSENYVCSEVQVLEYPPKLAIRNRPTVKSVVFKVKECDTLKERYDNSFGDEAVSRHGSSRGASTRVGRPE